jgi:hypothetical protein
MTALNSASITHGEFVKLVTASATYTFCNAAAAITVGGNTFSGLGSLLSVGAVNREIKATSVDMVIGLIGIDPTNVNLVLGADIKGSTLEVWRGFFDSNYQIITSPSTQFFKRYQGIVSNISLTEDWNENIRSRTVTASISCTSFRAILENKISGIRTNINSWQQLYPSDPLLPRDASMSRVAAISGQYFDFGAKPQTGSQASPGSDVVSGVENDNQRVIDQIGQIGQ